MVEGRKVCGVGVESLLARGDDAFLFGPLNLLNFLADPLRFGIDRGDAGLNWLDSFVLGLVR